MPRFFTRERTNRLEIRIKQYLEQMKCAYCGTHKDYITPRKDCKNCGAPYVKS